MIITVQIVTLGGKSWNEVHSLILRVFLGNGSAWTIDEWIFILWGIFRVILFGTEAGKRRKTRNPQTRGDCGGTGDGTGSRTKTKF